MLACYQMSHITFILLKQCQVRTCIVYNGWSIKYILETCFRNTLRGAARNEKKKFILGQGRVQYFITKYQRAHRTT